MARGALSLLLLLCGCSDHDQVEPIEVPEVEPAPEAASEPADEAVADGYREALAPHGAVTGVVRWRGPRPANPVLEVHAQHGACGRAREVPALVVGRDGGVADVVVSIEEVASGPRPAPREPVVLDQVGCRYEPHVVAIMEGQPLQIRNSDEVLHNVHAVFADGGEWFNVGQPRQGMSTTKVAERSGIARIVCDAGHAWMLAWVHVLPHPYFAVTDDAGRFRIDRVPAGEHTVRFWHQGWAQEGEASGRPIWEEPVIVERTVAVEPGAEAAIDLELPASISPSPAPTSPPQ